MVDDLDVVAASNLTMTDLARYHAYKAELIADGYDETSIREILTGYIWDASEEGTVENDEERDGHQKE